MKANTLTPFELFGSQVRYVVPMFQRPYVWEEEKQWQPLWEDVQRLAEDVLEQPAGGFGVPSVAPHFLGAVVFDLQLVPTAYTMARNVVDGQQRLTTLQLLLDAAQFVVQQHGDAADASALQMLVVNNTAVLQHEDEQFKVWPSLPDQEAFRAVMRDDLHPEEHLLGSQIVKAHGFFANAVTEWAEVEGDPDKARQRLHGLSLALMQHLKLVVIDLEAGDNAQVIFETLNHRGTPLLAGDLVKNLLFQIAKAEGEDVDNLYATYWKPFDDKAWRKQVRQGRMFRPRIDVFLNYWLAMRFQHVVASDRVFQEFRVLAMQPETSSTELLAGLAQSAEVFDHLELWPERSVEGTFYYRALKTMEQFALGPFLLWLLSHPDDQLPVAQRQRALQAVESWYVRRMLCRLTTKQVNQIVIDLLKELVAADPATAGDVVVRELAAETSESRNWPTDDDVRRSLSVLPLYTSLTRSRLRMVLEAIEDAQRSPMSDEPHCPRNHFTIEHVMPQGWREHWLLGDGDPDLLALNRDRHVHILGNLTLVNDRLNPALSNRPWTDAEAAARNLGDKGKRKILNEYATLHTNRQIVDSAPDRWDEALIDARGAALAEVVLQIWPNAVTFGAVPSADLGGDSAPPSV